MFRGFGATNGLGCGREKATHANRAGTFNRKHTEFRDSCFTNTTTVYRVSTWSSNVVGICTGRTNRKVAS